MHVLGRRRRMIVEVEHCPLHPSETQWTQPAILHINPTGAGPRVLSLDEGGVFAAVPLEVLRAIEEHLGGELPIQAFFDLMIGTDTGGLIAVALTMQNQSVARCTEWLESLYHSAFVPRLKSPRALRRITYALKRTPCYKTEPLHSALRKIDLSIILIIHSYPDIAPLRVHAGCPYRLANKEENRG